MRFLIQEIKEAANDFGRVTVGAVLVVAGVALAHVWGTGILEVLRAFGFGC